jgi:hypothetical protein
LKARAGAASVSAKSERVVNKEPTLANGSKTGIDVTIETPHILKRKAPWLLEETH